MKVAIVMGSASDIEIAKKAVNKLNEFEIESELRVISAHRAPNILREYVLNSECEIFIAIAGMAAHLAGAVAALTEKPVVAVPVKSSLQGLDALLSSVQMPKSVPVATVAIDGGENAAILACQMLAISDESLRAKLIEYKKNLEDEISKIEIGGLN